MRNACVKDMILLHVCHLYHLVLQVV